MIDKRFSLVPHPDPDYAHLLNLTFSVQLPPDRYYTTQAGLIIEEAKKQYPELDFFHIGDYSAKFPDGQYARCFQCIVKNAYVVRLVFSMPLAVDTILQATTGFKRAVRAIYFTVHPEELSTTTPEEFLEIVENMYGSLGLSLRIRAVSWEFNRMEGEPVYLIQPTDYDFV